MKKAVIIILLTTSLLFTYSCIKQNDSVSSIQNSEEEKSSEESSQDVGFYAAVRYKELVNEKTIETCDVTTDGNTITVNYTDGSSTTESYTFVLYDNGNIRNMLHYKQEDIYDDDLVIADKSDYNENGDATDEIQYKDGEIFTEKQSCYNPEGKRISTTSYKRDDSGEVQQQEYTELQYNSNGDIYEITSYNKDYQVTFHVSYIYSNDLMTIAYTSYKDDRTVLTRCDTICNQKKDPLKIMYYNEDGTISAHMEYAYDSKGNKTYEKSINEDNIIFNWYSAEYNDDGNMLYEAHYNEEGIEQTRTEYKYDKDGHNIEKDIIEDGKKNTEYIIEYDKNGNKIKEKYYDDNVSLIEYLYNNKNKMIKSVSYDVNGVILYYYEYVYNEDGVLINKKYYNGKGSIVDDTMYDDKGNLSNLINYDEKGNKIKSSLYEWEYFSYPENTYQCLKQALYRNMIDSKKISDQIE